MTLAPTTARQSAFFSGPTFGAYPHLRMLGRLIADRVRALRARVHSNRSS